MMLYYGVSSIKGSMMSAFSFTPVVGFASHFRRHFPLSGAEAEMAFLVAP